MGREDGFWIWKLPSSLDRMGFADGGGDGFELSIVTAIANLKRMEGLPTRRTRCRQSLLEQAAAGEERMLNLVVASGVPAGSGLGTSSVFF
ncbi:hypothetical protein ACLOJK_037686 [Asimina triloba]